jgi:hypothetical protein
LVSEAGALVVDRIRVLAGPYCVIGPFVDGRSAYFDSLNRVL